MGASGGSAGAGAAGAATLPGAGTGASGGSGAFGWPAGLTYSATNTAFSTLGSAVGGDLHTQAEAPQARPQDSALLPGETRQLQTTIFTWPKQLLRRAMPA